MNANVRPENMELITTKALAEAFRENQIKEIFWKNFFLYFSF